MAWRVFRLLLPGWLLLSVWAATAAQRRENLIYSKFDIDPGEWRYFEFPAKEKDARLQVQFEVQSPPNSSGVRVTVETAEEFRKFRATQPHREIGASAYLRESTFRTRLPDVGEYVVVIDSRMENRRKYRVEMEVTLTTGPDPESLPVEYASARKRLIVVSASVAGFLVIVLLAGRALWRATRNKTAANERESG